MNFPNYWPDRDLGSVENAGQTSTETDPTCMSARQFRRFIERVTRQGGADRCHGCGRTLSSGEVTLTGAGADGRGLGRRLLRRSHRGSGPGRLRDCAGG